MVQALPSDKLRHPTEQPLSTISCSDSSPASESNLAGTGIAVLDKLAALDVSRKQERERRKEESKELLDPRESTKAFLEGFAVQHQEVSSVIDDLLQQGTAKDIDQTKVQQQLDDATSILFRLERSIANASYYLPTYDQKQCTAGVADLKQRLEAARLTALPKRKFAFSKKVTRVKGSDAPDSGTVPGADVTGPSNSYSSDADSNTQPDLMSLSANLTPTERDIALAQSGRGLMGLRDQTVVLNAEQLNSQDFVLIDLEGCTVFLLGHMPALRMLNLKRCKVFTGPVTGSCFVVAATHCVLVLATYQARIHNTKDTDFYLRVKSKPIIEHTSAVRFAPYIFNDQRVQPLLEQHGLGEETGMYSEVDDFAWIKSVQSPNWCVVPEDERLPPTSAPEHTAL